METIGMDSLGNAPVRRLAGGRVVALLPGPGTVTVAHRLVCDELVPLAADPHVARCEEAGLIIAEAGPNATGRCRAEIIRWIGDGEVWECARGHVPYPAYDEAEAARMWLEEEHMRRAYFAGAR